MARTREVEADGTTSPDSDVEGSHQTEEDEDIPVPAPKKRKLQRSTTSKATSGKRKKADKTLIGRKRRKSGSGNRTEVMTNVPSIKKLKDYKTFPSFRAQMDDKTMVEFRKDQAVFVLADPATMENPDKVPEQGDYWLGMVKDIRAKSSIDKESGEWVADPGDVYVVVEWFYKPHDVSDTNQILPKTVDYVGKSFQFMGNKEIIASSDTSVISVFSCCDPVPIYRFVDDAAPDVAPVRLVDEKLRKESAEHCDPTDPEEQPNPLHASQANFFYRLRLPSALMAKRKKGAKDSKADENFELPLHCICQMPYSPSDQYMRYCLGCLKWYHEDCITASDSTAIEFDIPAGSSAPSALKKLALMPIIRGQEWGIGGNINIVHQARSIITEKALDDWESRMNDAGLEEWRDWEQMMSSADGKDHGDHLEKLYTCPACDEAI